ncbi:bifunctional NMN adenylyltransferase/nudix hydrolase [Filimonas lacunae]|uniref:Bifunctional NMN adenylyltransferase/nudix hydrolase n=1 Tax=Filimonas lacunae TaxID=477680 RepID=A0A173MM15_9BACT|nr:NUDIX domain-containing protein [Filimonas lacunae]BAV08674.1 nicotinamide-nucleotide adenylyltransferase [Filimonas lacunae]SIS59761.1 bifunctional NMN adenylyltransferase/nudix hydrolase [Filimonas lacunae]
MKVSGVIIARFQTPYLHEGHHHLIQSVQALHHRTIIILGTSAVKCSKRNPFDFYTRERMLKAAYPAIPVLPLSDCASDKVWSAKLDDILETTFPGESFVLYGSRDCFSDFYSGKWKTDILPPVGSFNATEVREHHSDEVLDSKDFRMGINYACYSRYNTVYPTVDIALFSNDNTRLLLGKKPNEDTWRLPGGFADTTDNSYEEAAQRELSEECGELTTTAMKYMGSRKMDDWRYRGESDKIMTLLFTTQLVAGEPVAKDDLAQLGWFEVAALPAMLEAQQINEVHIPLIQMILNHLNN